MKKPLTCVIGEHVWQLKKEWRHINTFNNTPMVFVMKVNGESVRECKDCGRDE